MSAWSERVAFTNEECRKFFKADQQLVTQEVRVTFEDGNSLVTRVNGTVEVVKEYYAIGKQFTVAHDVTHVYKLEFLGEGK